MNATSPHVSLRREDSSAQVALAGGELRRWRDHGRELLWDADARWWPRSCPVLFPIVGRLRNGQACIDGRRRPMGVHGFAGSQVFGLRAAHADRVTLGLASSDATRPSYPFEFDLSLSYRLHDGGLEMAMSLTNLGLQAMPFALGLHPGLRWPFSAASAAGHSVVFEHAESPLVPVITVDGLVSTARRTLPMHAGRLPLTAALFQDDALCFLDTRSRRLRFESPDGAAIVMTANGFPHWALWSRPGAPLLCIEVWTGYPDPEDFEGELADKPSMRRLAPGAVSSHRLNLCFEPDGLA